MKSQKILYTCLIIIHNLVSEKTIIEDIATGTTGANSVGCVV